MKQRVMYKYASSQTYTVHPGSWSSVGEAFKFVETFSLNVEEVMIFEEGTTYKRISKFNKVD